VKLQRKYQWVGVPSEIGISVAHNTHEIHCHVLHPAKRKRALHCDGRHHGLPAHPKTIGDVAIPRNVVIDLAIR
jgi:hypothetical protein